MRHRKIFRKFGRESHQRLALLRSLCTALIKYERIQTTLAKAKDLRRFVERVITLAKSENAMKKPEILKYIYEPEDKEIVGRNAIKNYLHNLPQSQRESVEKYLQDPKSNPKPDFVVEYLPSSTDRKGPRILRVEGVLRKLVTKIAQRFKDRSGGYTRIFKLGKRRGDAAEMALIELLPDQKTPYPLKEIGWSPCRVA